MTGFIEFESRLTRGERKQFNSLATPGHIQAFLDKTPYSAEDRYRAPATVLRDRMAHCFDGAVLAAAALHRLGHPPRIIDILPDDDDDHMIAIYKQNGRYGAVAKSNFVGLRWREPVYHTLRELVMSYFEQYYNVNAKRTMRAYTAPLNLKRFDGKHWLWRDETMDDIAEALDRVRQARLLTPAIIKRLTPVDSLTYKTGLLIANPKGLYKPGAS